MELLVNSCAYSSTTRHAAGHQVHISTHHWDRSVYWSALAAWMKISPNLVPHFRLHTLYIGHGVQGRVVSGADPEAD